MRVEVVKPFGIYSIGAIIPELWPGQARTLIARGLVREAPELAQARYPDRQIEASPVNRMMTPRRGKEK